MKQRLCVAVAIVLLVAAVASIAAAQTGSDSQLQQLIESTRPTGYVATQQFPNVGALGPDALSGMNREGVVFTPQDFAEHEIGFYGWHWMSTEESAGSRRVITIVGLSSTSPAEPREFVALFANDRREAGKKETEPALPDAAAFRSIARDDKQASLDVAFIRNDRAFIVTALGNDERQLQADVASLTQQLALGAEGLPSRVEGGSRSRTVPLAIALILVLAVLAGIGAFVRKSRGRRAGAASAEVSSPQIL